MHPHRGIETISYVYRGFMTHKDSLGNEDTIGEGEVQWMTAGSGIMHEEKIASCRADAWCATLAESSRKGQNGSSRLSQHQKLRN